MVNQVKLLYLRYKYLIYFLRLIEEYIISLDPPPPPPTPSLGPIELLPIEP